MGVEEIQSAIDNFSTNYSYTADVSQQLSEKITQLKNIYEANFKTSHLICPHFIY